MATDASPPPFGIVRIVEELRNLHSRRLTGTYYVVSEDNHQARIGLVDGEIESVTYRGASGPKALACLASIQAARTRFSTEDWSKAASSAAALPPTEKLLRALLNGAAAPAAVVPDHAEDAAAPATGGRLVSKLTTAELQWIRDALTDYLGPIANLVYDENRDPQLAVETMLAQLAAEIPGADQAAEFLAKARRGLHKSS
jgi:hypothetical protein